MISLPRDQADTVWQKYWDDMRSEWFKVELLQDYSGEDDNQSLRLWLRGDKAAAIRAMSAAEFGEWPKFCRSNPAKKVRLHVVEWPLSAYLEWEIELYKRRNIPEAKEAIHLVDRSDLPNLDLPNADFTIFDGQRVTKASYDTGGRMVSMDFYNEADDISVFLGLKEKLLKHATLLS